MLPKVPTDPAELRAWRDGTLYRLVLRASTAERTETLRQLHERGYRDVSITDTTLLANLDASGTTITDLATRSGITRQAASQQVQALQRRGYVRTATHPHDARALRVQRTAKGRRLLYDALQIVATIEAGYARHLGARQMRELKSTLALLLEHIDPSGSLAAG